VFGHRKWGFCIQYRWIRSDLVMMWHFDAPECGRVFCSIYGALFEVAWALCMNKHRLPLYKICVVSCGFSLKTVGQVMWHY